MEGQVRPGLGQDPRGDARPADRRWASSRPARSWRRSRRRSRTGTRSRPTRSGSSRTRPRSSPPSSTITDHEIGRLLEAIEDIGELDNTLVFYIAGDNGTSAEGGDERHVQRVHLLQRRARDRCPDMLKVIDKWGGPETYPHMAAGWAVAFDSPFAWTKQVASDFGGTRNGMVVHWPKGIKAKSEIRTPVRPRDRRRADDPGGGRPARAEGRQRHAADPDGGHEPASTRSTTRRRRSATRRSTSRSSATAPSTTTAGWRAPSTGRRGSRSPASRWPRTSGSSTTCAPTSASPNDLAAKNPKKLEGDAGALHEGGREVPRAADRRPRPRAPATRPWSAGPT